MNRSLWTEIKSHIGWLQMYAEEARDGNWRDMRLYAIRQSQRLRDDFAELHEQCSNMTPKDEFYDCWNPMEIAPQRPRDLCLRC